MNDITLISRNKDRWAKATFKQAFLNSANSVAKRLVSSKVRYQVISAKTGVPWYIIAVIHEREASQRWDRSLAQGDPWNRLSIHVPKGRGPFTSFEDAAYDALMNCPPYAGKWTDWSMGGALTLLEKYNGLGYANKGLPSPYIWSGTDQYISGKYVSDGVFDPNVVDSQLGCAILIKQMMVLDTSIGQPVMPAAVGWLAALAASAAAVWHFAHEYIFHIGLGVITIAAIWFIIHEYRKNKTNV